MTEKSTFVGAVDTGEWEPFEAGEIKTLRAVPDTPYLSGVWRVTPEQAPEPQDVHMHADETVYIVEGHVTVEVDGEVLELRAGSFAAFKKGSSTRWTVREPTLEFFVYS